MPLNYADRPRGTEKERIASSNSLPELITNVIDIGKVRNEVGRVFTPEQNIASILFWSKHNGGSPCYSTEFDVEGGNILVQNILSKRLQHILLESRVINLSKLLEALEKMETEWQAAGKPFVSSDVITRTFGIRESALGIVASEGRGASTSDYVPALVRLGIDPADLVAKVRRYWHSEDGMEIGGQIVVPPRPPVLREEDRGGFIAQKRR